MYDYSLAQASNRLAVAGDNLVVHRFPTGTIGLRPYRRRLREVLFPSAVTAVCIPPGARILLQDIPTKLQQQLGITSDETVIFIHRSLEVNTHRDGVRFTNGCEIFLQPLEPGQRARVVSLDCEDHKSNQFFETSDSTHSVARTEEARQFGSDRRPGRPHLAARF